MDLTEFLKSVGGCIHGFSLSYGLPLSLLLAGLVGGATHCVGMCGPFVIAQAGRVERLRDAALIPYHLGRISTYVALAALFSSILNLAFLFLPIRQLILMPLLLMAGLVFLVSAFPVLRTLFPWSGGRMISLPYRLVSKAAGVLANTPGMLKKYLMGVLLGFMPCGLVTSALMAASSASNAGQAALAMAAFGLGTMPALILTAFSGHSLKLKFPKTMAYVTRGLMTISALWLFALAGMMLI